MLGKETPRIICNMFNHCCHLAGSLMSGELAISNKPFAQPAKHNAAHKDEHNDDARQTRPAARRSQRDKFQLRSAQLRPR
jgi:hypothetical protein